MASRSKKPASGSGETGTRMVGEFRSGPIAGTTIIQKVSGGQKGLVYAEVDGLAIFEGDIVLGTVLDLQSADPGEVVESVGITGQQFRWPNATIPYEIDPAMPNQQRITDAIAHWQAKTRIRFVQRTAVNAAQFPDFVVFQSGGGCSSQVGRRSGRQVITLGNGCSLGNAIHEIGHTVGLWHEQSREDRDSFVQIVWSNIDPSMQHNFAQHISDGDDLGAYDYGSMMHYPATAFSTNGQATIIPLQSLPAGVVMGQRNGLSQGDINGVHAMYPAPFPTIKEIAKDAFTDPGTFKEVRKDPITDTIKEVRKDPITDTFKEVRKDPITDTFKEVGRDRIDPIPRIPPIVGPGPRDMVSPFILATPNRADAGVMDTMGAATQQVQELAAMIDTLQQQQADLIAAYDEAVQILSDLQQGQA
jgi:Astacin (Peptidase family M12A)